MSNENAVAEDTTMNRVMNVINHEIEVLELEVKNHADRLALVLKPATPEVDEKASSPMDGEDVSQLSEAILALASRIRQQQNYLSSLDRRLDL